MATDFCLIFDCDGTLVDSEPLLAEVLAETLTEAGLPFVPSDYMDTYRGVAYAQIVAALEQKHGAMDERYRDSAEQKMRARLLDRMRGALQTIEGIEEALDTLDNPRCVASNGPLAKIRLSMETTGLARHFGDNLFSAYEVGIFKPDPGLYLYTAETMGYPPERCIVIDDAAVGIKAGMDAGMHVIHINRFSSREATPEGAHQIDHMNELARRVIQIEQGL
ncbi:HAD family hydrolase [Phytohalomonas tamaricis]|uniref:HAD family hydrolase n=1 Tax=Phytohalomonas tamaricis TaxID=2081032 RepID=UPI000D0BE764|nr:HAD-IA family hydrolase [Phytohalomonas tamaricis]